MASFDLQFKTDQLRQHCYSSLYRGCEINIAVEIIPLPWETQKFKVGPSINQQKPSIRFCVPLKNLIAVVINI